MAKNKKMLNEQKPVELSDEQLESVTGGVGNFNAPTQQVSLDFQHKNDIQSVDDPTLAVKENNVANPFPEKKPFIFKK